MAKELTPAARAAMAAAGTRLAVQSEPLHAVPPADDPIGGFVMTPEPRAIDEAAAVICGHDFIRDMGEEKMLEFHGFVQEVLESIIAPEIQRLLGQGQRDQLAKTMAPSGGILR